MKNISDEGYNNVQAFYKKMKFKNLREYFEFYLKLDITLLADNFDNFRKIMFDEFQLDPVKYV